jgi:protein-tyrosine-phosphatase
LFYLRTIRAKKILFVCIKNASRSPMAEALLKMSARRGIQVCSADFKAW